MPEVSVIVPVYNSEKSLKNCIESIIRQTFSDFELIIINDGSTDNSRQICEQLQQKDARIMICNQSNAGVSAARNKGVTMAQGKYIMFCDSDDCVAETWIEAMYDAVVKNPDSLVTCDVRQANKDESACKLTGESSHISYFDLYKMGLSAYTPNKIYNKSIIERNSLLFDINCSLAEDVKFNCEYYNNCKDVVFINKILYFYNVSDDGLSLSYKANGFDMHKMPFQIRLKHIGNENLTEYCNIWLFHFLALFANIFDKRNTKMSLFEKFRYNNKMIKSEEFQFCVSNSSENDLFKKVLKIKNYYIFWIFQKLISLKQKIRSQKL